MANAVDQRVVEMQFDNSNFNRNVQSTISSLTQLDKSLELKSGSASLERVQNSVNNFDVNPVSAAIGKVGSGLGLLGSTLATTIGNVLSGIASVGKTATLAVGGLTAAVGGLAVSGGIKRALNLEHANFQLQGLLKSDKEVQKVMNDVNEAVTGTAYGLDEAAVVASQLAASNVKASESGGEMLNVLKAIAGTAAMGGRSFADVGSIFATVAGQGKLMTMQLRQMESMGLNAAATLAEALGKDEATIREMVTRGEIDFATFAKAMSDAFGEHAQKANETFTGAMSNVKAALSRVGAEFAMPSIENLRKIFVATIPVINSFKTMLAPVVDIFKELTGNATKGTVAFLKDLNKWVKQLDQSFHLGDQWAAVIKNVAGVFGYFGDMFKPIIGKQLTQLPQWGRVFGNVFSGVGNVMKELSRFAPFFKSAFWSVFRPIEGDTLSSKLIKFSANVRNFLGSFKLDNEHMSAFEDILEVIFNSVRNVGVVFGGAFKGVMNILQPALEFIWAKLPEAAKTFKDFGHSIYEAIGPAESIAKVLENLGTLIGSIFKEMTAGNNPFEYLASNKFQRLADSSGLGFFGDVIGNIGRALMGLDGNSSKFFDSLSHWLSNLTGKEVVINNVADAVRELLKALAGFGTGIIDAIIGGGERVGGILSSMGKGIKQFLSGASTKDITGLATAIGTLWTALNISNTKRDFKKFFSNFGTPFEAFVGTIRNLTLGPMVKVFDRLGTALAWWQNTLKAEMILKIAAAIGIITICLIALAGVDDDALMRATQSMLAIGLAVSLFAVALVNLTKVMPSTSQGMGRFVDTFIELKNQMQQVMVLNALGNLVLKFAIAIFLLAKAVKTLAKLEPEELAKGLAALAAVMVLMIGSMMALGTMEKLIDRAGSAMVGMGAGILIISFALKVLATIPMEKMGNVFTSLVIVFGALVGTMAALDKVGGAKQAASLTTFALAIALMTPALIALSLIPMENIAQMMLALGGAFTVLIVALYAMDGLKPTQLAAISSALITLAAAVLILAPALLMLSAMGFEGVAVATVALAAAFGVLGVSAFLLEPLVPVLLLIAQSVALFGAGLLLAGVGVVAFSIGLASLAAGGTASILILIEGFKMLVEAVCLMIPQIVTAVALGLVDLMLAIGAKIPEIVQMAITVGTAILEGLSALISPLVALGAHLLQSLLQGLESVFPQVTSTGIGCVLMLAVGFVGAIPSLIEIATQALLTFIHGLADTIRAHHNEAYEAAKDLFMALLEALWGVLGSIKDDIGNFIMNIPAYISGEKKLFEDSGTEMGEATSESAKESFSDLPKVGETAVSDTIQAMKDKFKDADGLGDGIGTSLQDSIASADLGSVGADKVQELVNSMSNTADVENAGKKLGDSGVKGADTSLKELKSTASSRAKEAIKSMTDQKDEANAGGTEVGNEYGSGMIKGLNNWIGPIADKAAEIVRTAKNRAKTEQRSNSPSKDTMEIGGYFGEGYAIGITNTFGMVSKAASRMVKSAKDEVTGLGPMSLLTGGVDWDSRPVISPVLDLTDYKAGLAVMNAMNMSRPMMSAQLVAGGIQGYSGQVPSTSNVRNVSVSIDLNYGGSEDANQLVMDIAQGLETKLMMEGE